MERKNVWSSYTAEEKKELTELNNNYISFLNAGKTERECVKESIRLAEAHGYKDIETFRQQNKKLQPGDRVYAVNMKKSIALFQIGTGKMEEGLLILGAHIDSPRLDVKQNPLYEDTDFAYLDTHYYGGVKKYQWVTLPLALHGVVVKKDGTTVLVNIGEEEDDPVFFVSDLLIHLAQDQLEKKAAKVIEGEALDIIVGSKPLTFGKEEKDKEKDKEKNAAKEAVKAGVLEILKKQYGIEEEDFISAELEVVPAGKAREAGFDRSMILAYGQDDRVCAYTSFRAMLDLGPTKRSVCCILVDKEEIGSVGATGMQSHFFENAVAEVLELCGDYNELTLRRCLANSCMLSSDVSSAYDPTYSNCFDKKNVAYMGQGLVLMKFTGSRGKSGSNDANAEYLAKLRKVFDEKKVHFQTAELGKVDVGGGGTIAFILALYGMNVVDSGVAVMNMHAPWEATSKADIYEAYKGYKAFAEMEME